LIELHGRLDGDGQPRRVKNQIEGNIVQTDDPTLTGENS